MKCGVQSIHTYWHTSKASSLTPIHATSKRNRLYLCACVLLEKTLQLIYILQQRNLAKQAVRRKDVFREALSVVQL